MRPAFLALLLGTALLASGGCGGSDSPSPAADGVSDLTRVDELRDAFEADDGRARFVVLFSPT